MTTGTRRWLWAAGGAIVLVAGVARAATELREGDAAPGFTAKGDDGKEYSLAALKGKHVVLYFYPKDDTPGCTVEAKNFRDESARFREKGAVVLGVSLDDAASHREFRAKYQLDFPLLVGGRELAALYGVPTTFGMAKRQTFLIGKDGRIRRIYRSVDVETHAKELLKLLD